MAKFEVLETYNSEIEKLEPTTPGHADVFNAIFQQLINNDAFIKKVAEQQLTIIQSHLNNENEPHQKVFDTYYRQLVNYTDKAIADLINGAPETADTLRELADLIDKNKDVATALNEAIGKKANQTELDQAISDINTLNSGLTLKVIDLGKGYNGINHVWYHQMGRVACVTVGGTADKVYIAGVNYKLADGAKFNIGNNWHSTVEFNTGISMKMFKPDNDEDIWFSFNSTIGEGTQIYAHFIYMV